MTSTRYLQREYITLRAVEPHDLDYLYLRENDSSIWHEGATVAPYSRAIIHQYIDQYTADIYRDRQLRLIVTLNTTGERMGIADLYEYDPTHNRAGVGLYIDPQYRRQGYGREALLALCDYAFGMLHMHQLYAIARTSNTPSLSLFASCGFDRHATLHEWIYEHGQYTDAVLMQHTHSETKHTTTI